MRIQWNPRWSVTRSNTRKECPRAYFYQYFAKGEDFAKPAQNLKLLKGLPVFRGHIVEAAIKKCLSRLKAGKQLPSDPASWFKASWDKCLADAKDRAADLNEYDKTKAGPSPLLEVYYDDPGLEAKEATEFEKAKTAFINFVGSDVLAHLKSTDPKLWRYSPAFSGNKVHAEKCMFGNVPAYIQIDFHAMQSDGALLVIDWKSGVPHAETHQLQAILASLWGQKKFGLAPEKVQVEFAYLLHSGPFEPKTYQNTVLEETLAYVALDWQEELSALDYRADVGFVAKLEDFGPKPNIKTCRSCCFRELCQKGQDILRQSDQ